jgi:phosphoglycerate dehydrogenase-like enzyme
MAGATTMRATPPPAATGRVVLVTEGSDPAPLAWLRERVRVVEAGADDPRFAEHLAAADGMVVRTYTKVDDALLARAPRLRVVGRGGVGWRTSTSPLPPPRRRGRLHARRQHARRRRLRVRLLLHCSARGRPSASASTSRRSSSASATPCAGRQLNELTLGVLGMGRVGKRVGHIGAPASACA